MVGNGLNKLQYGASVVFDNFQNTTVSELSPNRDESDECGCSYQGQSRVCPLPADHSDAHTDR